MNVGRLCKQVPAYLPHELLGYSKDNLEGTLLSIDIVSKLNEEENEQASKSNAARSSRYDKFKRNK